MVVGTSSVFGGFPNIVSHSFAVSNSKNATMSSGLIIVPEKNQVSLTLQTFDDSNMHIDSKMKTCIYLVWQCA